MQMENLGAAVVVLMDVHVKASHNDLLWQRVENLHLRLEAGEPSARPNGGDKPRRRRLKVEGHGQVVEDRAQEGIRNRRRGPMHRNGLHLGIIADVIQDEGLDRIDILRGLLELEPQRNDVLSRQEA
eukprot:CAMPEP_0180788906 /NCGR_PEP_ID=MMETSP1038_2-20121128/52290_1 /TAXON_ID=632150 /ORGANISM="Azadinium spinosum, Strain 3D9" /LENGTH=126 /DNA_ID=CAMNT_0022826539 /DNA_START=221 /DNA_END=601 /DNA_ORIENTATION=+